MDRDLIQSQHTPPLHDRLPAGVRVRSDVNYKIAVVILVQLHVVFSHFLCLEAVHLRRKAGEKILVNALKCEQVLP
jgi:hypothetical protein